MHLYFSGIGGSGLAPLAHLALDCGLQVSGSDIQESLNLKSLRERGVKIGLNQDGNHLQKVHTKQPVSWLVHTSAINTSTHPEYQLVQTWNSQNPEGHIRTSKRSDLLNYVIKKKRLKLLAVAGTHGKTTTTAMLVWLFKQLKIPVSYLIGTNITFGPAAQYQEGSEYFIYECDEFDRNFLDFHPFATLLTSLDYDHPDTYPSQESYYEAFRQFFSQTEYNVIGWSENLLNFNFEAQLPNLSKKNLSPQIDQIILTGRHNRENAFLAIQLLSKLIAQPVEELEKLVESFPGTQRRFEKLARNVFTDYAHHPTEIRATLQMAAEYRHQHNLKESKIIAVYQPHQNSRQHLIKKDYQNAFDRAEMIYWLATYLTREDPELPVLPAQELSNYVDVSKQLELQELDEVLAKKLQAHQKNNDIIVFMGAGNIDDWARTFTKNLDN